MKTNTDLFLKFCSAGVVVIALVLLWVSHGAPWPWRKHPDTEVDPRTEVLSDTLTPSVPMARQRLENGITATLRTLGGSQFSFDLPDGFQVTPFATALTATSAAMPGITIKAEEFQGPVDMPHKAIFRNLSSAWNAGFTVIDLTLPPESHIRAIRFARTGNNGKDVDTEYLSSVLLDAQKAFKVLSAENMNLDHVTEYDVRKALEGHHDFLELDSGSTLPTFRPDGPKAVFGGPPLWPDVSLVFRLPYHGTAIQISFRGTAEAQQQLRTLVKTVMPTCDGIDAAVSVHMSVIGGR